MRNLFDGTYRIVRELPGQAFATWDMVPPTIRTEWLRAAGKKVGLGEAGSPAAGFLVVGVLALFGLAALSMVKGK